MKVIVLLGTSLLVGLASGQLSSSGNQSDTPQNGTLNSCASVKCPVGKECEETTVQCSVAPCPKAVSCVRKGVWGCDVMRCESNETCEETELPCLKAPCGIRIACVSIHTNGTSGPTTYGTSDSFTSPDYPPNVCPQNQTRTNCINKCNEEKCPGNGFNYPCTKYCGFGCTCAAGFVRSSDDRCYKLEDCPTDVYVPMNPCTTMRCASGTKCQNLGINCTTLPCENYGACVNTTVVDNLAGGCATLICGAGTTCQETLVKCANAPCPRHAKCVPDLTQNDTLDSCANVTCPMGQICEETTVQCSVAPCPKAFSCVRQGVWGCDIKRCKSNEICEETELPCLKAPCPIRLACVKIIHINGTSGSTNSTSTTNPLSVCPMNQTMSDCLNKCSEEKCPGIGISMMCTKHCGQGCACAAGFVRSSNGECYKSKDCPLEQVCGDNEEYRCENCAATCKNPEPNCPELHNKKCNKKCICAAGFVKKNGKCVTLASCPDHDHNNITCLGTEEYTDCLPKCRQLCSGSTQCNKNSHTDMCTPGCVCRPSYKLDSNGTCVHNKHCFKTTDCPVNEEWSKCISLDNVCGMATIQKVPLRNQCFSGCVCAAGFARNSNGTCVEQDKC